MKVAGKIFCASEIVHMHPQFFPLFSCDYFHVIDAVSRLAKTLPAEILIRRNLEFSMQCFCERGYILYKVAKNLATNKWKQK